MCSVANHMCYIHGKYQGCVLHDPHSSAPSWCSMEWIGSENCKCWWHLSLQWTSELFSGFLVKEQFISMLW
jgi:hypothetical protein